MSDTTSNSHLGFGGLLLTLVFITLKLTNFIDWSWWWVLAPLWAPLVIVAVIFTLIYVMHGYK